MANSDVPVIEIRDLHKAYGALEVLKGVDLVAHAGNVISLIGSSGSGKSTLLRCANLLEESQQGEILFHGEPITWKGTGHNRHPSDRAQVTRIRTELSMVFQQFNLWAHMSILQNVMEAPVTVLGQDKDEVETRARKLLDKVGIGDKAYVYPAQLSGGQQQRAAIARGLCMEPKALLFDACLSGCHPHPLYVGYGVEWLGRRTKRGWMFRSAKTFRFRGRFPSFNDFSRMTRPVPPTWRRRGGVTGSSAPIARRRQSRSASPAGPASCAVESAAATPG